MLNVSALLLDDALKPATPLTNGAISETLGQFPPLSDDRLPQLVDCGESSTLIDRLLKGNPNSVIDWIQVRTVWGHISGSMNVTRVCQCVVQQQGGHIERCQTTASEAVLATGRAEDYL